MDRTLFSYDKFSAVARQVIAEGCVLLRNENSALPLLPGSRAALFGRTQMNYFKSGLGSGGLVNTRYVTGIYEALKDSGDIALDPEVRQAYELWTKDHPFEIGDGWSRHPWFQQEMSLDEELVRTAALNNDAAIVIIGRTAGEDRDNMDEPGSWQLTEGEEQMLDVVCRHFERTVVLLNTGNIIDMTWVEKYDPSAVMYVWQGGQEGGCGVADVLSGRVNPSGRLTDTIARSVADYPSANQFGDKEKVIYTEDIYVGYRYFETLAPEAVLYHFGEGLSYTEFSHRPLSFSRNDGSVTLRHSVTNIGDAAGKEVVQVYARLPQGKLGKPALTLCGFAKTDILQPGETAEVEFTITDDRLASYDDSGVTGSRCCFVLEEGSYEILAGHSIRGLASAGSFDIGSTVVLSRHRQACAPVEQFDRLRPVNGSASREPVPTQDIPYTVSRAENLPVEIPRTEYCGFKLEDVVSGKCTMEQFVAQMTDDDLCCIVRGEGMSSPRVTPGTAGAFGGVTERLVEQFGIPAACCADGPSGIRMDCGNTAFSMPNGACQACSWNEALVSELYIMEGLEMRKYQVDNLLGPGINIHRHPLNGRNFEYFSEDPLVTGRMACAQLKGLRDSGVTGTIKHFACNNQEFYRRMVNAVVSERALREIYLRGFEIAVREGGARSVMTSYNPLNSCWTASQYDLVTTILREEWGFDGIVMTDWWAMGSEEGKEPSVSNVASMIRAQNDLFMVTSNPSQNTGDDDSAESLAAGTVTRAEYQRSAMNICRFVAETPAFRRFIGKVSDTDRQLQQLRDEEGDVILHVPELEVGAEVVIDGKDVELIGGKKILYRMILDQYGQYRISITCRAAEGLPDTAQLPVSSFIESFLLGSHVFTGADKDWQTFSVTTMEVRIQRSFYIKFFLAVGGLDIKEIRITRVKTAPQFTGKPVE
ncbi:MAG: beta-glucosidase [Ruminococcaceae bacterium]|nr:beta-glucosidase [Oscillospiraceae bacterium]